MKTVIALMAVLGVALMTVEACAFDYGPPATWDDKAGGSWSGYDRTRHLETDADTDYMTLFTLAGPLWDVDDWDCDEIRLQGAVQWYDTRPGWAGKQGLVGIDNTKGTQVLTGSLVFHINNFINENDEKWVWDEVYWYTTPAATIRHGLYVQPPPASVYVTQDQKVNGFNLADGSWHENLDGRIVPNPDAEEIIFDFYVPPGEEAYIDSFEVATMCVPEPATIALLGLGALALIRRRRG